MRKHYTLCGCSDVVLKYIHVCDQSEWIHLQSLHKRYTIKLCCVASETSVTHSSKSLEDNPNTPRACRPQTRSRHHQWWTRQGQSCSSAGPQLLRAEVTVPGGKQFGFFSLPYIKLNSYPSILPVRDH